MASHDSDNLMDFVCSKCGHTFNRKEWLCYRCSGINLKYVYNKDAPGFVMICKKCCNCGEK